MVTIGLYFVFSDIPSEEHTIAMYKKSYDTLCDFVRDSIQQNKKLKLTNLAQKFVSLIKENEDEEIKSYRLVGQQRLSASVKVNN